MEKFTKKPMIKRLSSDQIQAGMYIHDLDCAWMAHPFLANQFKLTQQSEIDKIRAYGIRSVYIDTDRGLDFLDAPTVAQVHAEADRALRQVFRSADKPLPRVTVSEEMVVARQVLLETRHVVHDLLNDVRLGRQVELEKIEPVVDKIIQSVLRNSGALTSLGRVKQKDNYTFEHSVNVGVLLVNFCQFLGLDAALVRAAAIGGLLHDIGKMKTPDAILNKPGKLTDAEFVIMREHVSQGLAILRLTPGISEVSMAVVAQHHEHMDGGGYPEGLKGDEISQIGQMAAIVDVYDALTSLRVYHPPMEPAEALRKLFEWSQFHFNGELVQQFIQCVGIYPVGTVVRLASGLVGVVVEESTRNLLHPKVRVVHDSHRDCRIVPRDIDLAAPGAVDHIVSHESAARWKIDPRVYL